MIKPIIIEKSQSERYQIGLADYTGGKFVDVRIHYNDEGEWRPTQRWIAIRPERVEEFIAALRTAAEAAHR